MCCDHGPLRAGRATSVLTRLVALGATAAVLVGVAVAADPSNPQAVDRPPAPAPRVDAEGVPLPAGVIARLGSTRLRQPNAVTAVAVAPNGRTVASAGADGVRVWEAATGKLVGSFPLPGVITPLVGFAGDGRDLLCLTLRQFARGRAAAPVGGGGAPAGARAERTFHRLDAATGKEKLRIALPTALAVLNASGRRLAYVDGDGAVRVADTATGDTLHRLTDLGIVTVLVLSADDRTLAVGDGGDTITLYDVVTGTKTGALKRENARYAALAIAPDGRTLAALHQELPARRGGAGAAPGVAARPVPEVHLWNLPAQQYRGMLQRKAADHGPATLAPQVHFAPDGKTLVTTARGSRPTLWDAGTGQEIRPFDSVAGLPYTAFFPDGRTLVVGTGTGTLLLWDVATAQPRPASANPPGGVNDLRYAAGGRRVIGTSAKRFTAWDPVTGRELERTADVPAAQILDSLSPDGRLLSGVEAGGVVRTWDAATGREVRAMEVPRTDGGPPPRYSYTTFTPDGRRLIGATDVSRQAVQLAVWDTASGRVLRTFSGPTVIVMSLTVSADGRRLVLSGYDSGINADGQICVWDLTTYAEVRRLSPPGDWAFDPVAVSPDGRWVALIADGPQMDGHAGGIQLWDIDAGRQVRSWPTGLVSRMVFSPDGRTLATGRVPDGGLPADQDPALRLWEVATGGERQRFAGHTSRVTSIAFAPDGRTLAAGSNDAPVYVWDVLNLAEFAGRPPAAAELDQAWAALVGADAKAAFQALRRLSAAPDPAVTFLQERLKPAVASDGARVLDLIRRLDSARFVDRQQAAAQLEQLGEPAVAELRAALKDATSAEVQQTLQRLLDAIAAGTPETLRSLRAVEALEYIGTPAARMHLKALAGGAAGTVLTDAAGEALRRLEK
jgi:WD40 repeat protein